MEVIMDIGFIGIGQMGKHLSRRILDAGYNLMVHDLNKESATQLLEKGARWGNTPGEVARSCWVVITCLPAPQDVEQVVYGQDGLTAGWKEGDIYIDMSTDSPSTIRRIAEDAGDQPDNRTDDRECLAHLNVKQISHEVADRFDHAKQHFVRHGHHGEVFDRIDLRLDQ